MRTLLLLIAVFPLAACSGSTAYVKAADPCARPVQIPSGWVSDAQIERLWRTDRQALLDCGDKVEVLSGRAPL